MRQQQIEQAPLEGPSSMEEVYETLHGPILALEDWDHGCIYTYADGYQVNVFLDMERNN